MFERLPKTVIPTLYDLHFDPDLVNHTFTGHEIVHLQVEQSTHKIVCHSLNLVLSNVRADQNGHDQMATQIEYDLANETVTYHFANRIDPGFLLLQVDFEGKLEDNLKGFYRSTGLDKNGQPQTIACTQFEATDARRAFPCWDEPSLKAVFAISIAAPKDLVCLSNMPVQSTVDIPRSDKVCHQYQTSPVMSTYLVVLIVGQFDFVETMHNGKVPVRVITPPGKSNHGQFALDVARRCLALYDEWFDIPYPLPKLDLVAIPDFGLAGMENFGCITYAESYVLVDPQESSVSTKQNVAIVVAHECGHSWFGNYVTMRWWSDLWLNESFASWMEYFAVDKLFPQWNIWNEFVGSAFTTAMQLDGLSNTHPIEVEVNHPNEIDEIFDAISYDKGATVVRMLEQWLGHETFRQGIISYLKTYAYRNATTLDLWTHMEQVSNKPVRQMMQKWTRSPGYPLLIVESCTVGPTCTYQIKQQRFFQNGQTSEQEQQASEPWILPISIVDSYLGICPTQTLDQHQGTVQVSKVGKSAIKFNVGQTGLYRVLYTPEMLDDLKRWIQWQLNNVSVSRCCPELSTVDRLAIQNDAFALCRSGHLRAHQLIDLVGAYHKEPSYSVWADLSYNLGYFVDLFRTDSNAPMFNQWLTDLYSHVLERVGWDAQANESEDITTLRTTILRFLGCTVGSQAIRQEAVRRFNQDRSSIKADLRQTVYTIAVLSNGQYDQMMQLVQQNQSNQEECTRCLKALAADKSRTQQTIEYALSGQVRKQDVPSLLSVCAHYNLDTTWHYCTNRWLEIIDKFGGGYLLSTIVNAFGSFCTQDRYDQVKQFFDTHEAPAAKRAVKQTLENIQSNIQWNAREQQAVDQWLDTLYNNN